MTPEHRHRVSEIDKRIAAIDAALSVEKASAIVKLFDGELVETTFAEIFTALRIEMGAVPAGMTRDLALRADLEKRHNDAFDRCAAAFEKARQALGSGSAILDGDEDGEP